MKKCTIKSTQYLILFQEHQRAEAPVKDYSDSSSGDSLFRTNSANNIKPNDSRLRELSNEEKDALFRTDKEWDTMSESSISSVDQTAEVSIHVVTATR